MTTPNIEDAQLYGKIYNIAMGLLNLLGFLCFVPLIIFLGIADPEFSGSEGTIFITLMTICTAVFTLPFAVGFLWLAFNIKKKHKLIYYLVMVSYAFSFSGLLTIIFGIIGIVKWADVEVQKYYLEEKSAS